MDDQDHTTPAHAESVSSARLPWEDPGLGGLDGFFQTVILFITRPDEAFARVSPTGIGRPFFYAVVMAWIEALAFVAYWVILEFPFVAFSLPDLDEAIAEAAISTGVMVLIVAGVIVLLPLFVAVGLAVHTCILHLMLLIVGEGKGGFETTVRALCYAHTADLANLIPICGGLVSLVWFVALQIVGVSRCHRCSYGKAALAVFLPILLCCSCLTVAVTLLGVFAMAD